MEFDKSKILTCVTADQAKVGQKGWFASNVETLSRLVLEEQPKELLGVDSNNAVHAFKTAFQNHALFYPAPEHTYAERQAQWVKENNVKEGTKVRVIRTFTEDEDGSSCCEHDDLVGMTGVVSECNIDSHNLVVDMNDGNFRVVPYFVLEVVSTEPTYEDKFRAWVKENNVKKGDRFVITLGYWEESNEMGCIARTGMYGKKGKITRVSSEYRCFLNAELDGGTPVTVPYNAIQILNEPWFNVGDKVRILMKASGMYNEIGVVTRIDVYKNGEQLVMVKFKEQLPKGFRASKKEYLAEVVKEPTYRPFKNAEEFKPFRDEWFVSKCDNSQSSSVKALSYSNLGAILLREVTKSEDVVFDLCKWDEFFTWFVRENGEPCGERVE